MHKRVVIVGAGAAGTNAARELAGAEDIEVVVVAEESGWPYNRTTVNKGFLSGSVDAAAVELPGLRKLPMTWVSGQRATALDPENKKLMLSDGNVLDYQALLLACGSRARTLTIPIDDVIKPRVVTLRSLTDAQALRSHLGWTNAVPTGATTENFSRSPVSAVVVGGGFIGAETASILRAGGVNVTIVDPSPNPLQRHLGPTVARWAEHAHAEAGVGQRTRQTVTAIQDAWAGRNRPGPEAVDPTQTEERLRITFSDGTRARATVVVVCMGVQPATRWLRYAFADNPVAGIPVDANQRAPGHPGLYAAGECATETTPEKPARAEHWGTALEQGTVAAATILADLTTHPAQPSTTRTASRNDVSGFSTYLHGTKLTILGSPTLAAGDVPILGAPGDDRFAVALLDHEQRIVGGVGVGGARAVNTLKSLIASKAPASELPRHT